MIPSLVLIGSAGLAFMAVLCRDAIYTNIAMTVLCEFGVTSLLRHNHVIDFVENKDFIDTSMVVTATLPITLINVDFLIRHELIGHQFAAPIGLCTIVGLVFIPQNETIIKWFKRGVIYANCVSLILLGLIFDRKSYFFLTATVVLTNLFHVEVETMLERPNSELFLIGNSIMALLTVYALPLTAKKCFCWR